MAVLEIRVEGLDRVQSELAKLGSLLQRNWKRALNNSLDYMEQKRAIPHLRDPAIKPLKRATILRKMRDPNLIGSPQTPLIRTGAMLQSIRGGAGHKRGTDPAGLSGWTGTSLRDKGRSRSYPATHQYGYGQVKRQFLFFDTGDEKQVAKFFTQQLKEKIRKAGFKGI